MIRMIRIGNAWFRPGEIAAVQPTHTGDTSVFLHSGVRLIVCGVTAVEVIRTLECVAAAAREPVTYPPAPDPVRTPRRWRQQRPVTIPTPPAKDWR